MVVDSTPLVHLIVEDSARRLLVHWLSEVGIPSRSHSHLGEFLGLARADMPSCLVIDAQPTAIHGLVLQALLLPQTIHCPIVVAANLDDIPVAAGTLKQGAIDLLRKPLVRHEAIAAICGAMEVDRHQRLAATWLSELRLRFATLSTRERQVLSLVTAGLMNKQAAAELGVSEITVKAHRGAAMRKLGAGTFADLIRMADLLRDRLPQPGSRHPIPRIAAAGYLHGGVGHAHG